MNFKNLSFLGFLVSSVAFPSGPGIVRAFDCRGTYQDINKQTGTFTASLTDFIRPDPDAMGGRWLYWSSVVFTAPFIHVPRADLTTELQGEDSQADRDDAPEAREHLGGIGHYGMLLRGTMERPLEDFVLVTKSDREQRDRKKRSYRFFFLRNAQDAADPDSDRVQEQLAKGNLVCVQR